MTLQQIDQQINELWALVHRSKSKSTQRAYMRKIVRLRIKRSNQKPSQ